MMLPRWDRELARFCSHYHMTPDDFFRLTWRQYQALAEGIVENQNAADRSI